VVGVATIGALAVAVEAVAILSCAGRGAGADEASGGGVGNVAAGRRAGAFADKARAIFWLHLFLLASFNPLRF